MRGNSFGKALNITTFGESHGPMMGVVIDGLPPNMVVDEALLKRQLSRRRPGQSSLTTQRNEADQPQIVSGVFEGKTLGTPVAVLLPNTDQHSSDYDALRSVYRPSHADYTYAAKFGHRDHRGGGRASARETACRVAAGAFAQMLLATQNIAIAAYVSQVGEVKYEGEPTFFAIDQVDATPVRCPNLDAAQRMVNLIDEVRLQGDSVGGIITCVIKGCPPGLGEPVFDRLHADMGKAMLSINAVKGFELGSGFAAASLRGSQHNDGFAMQNGQTITTSNHSGGVQGGISNGMDIVFRVAFKPVATIALAQTTINEQGEALTLAATGRHDPCVVPRAVPIVEAMAALVLADHLLRQRTMVG